MQSIALIPGSDGTTNASLMTVQAVRAPGAATIVVNTVTGVPAKFYGSMGTPHTFTDPVTGETITIISEATAVDFAGHVDTGNLVIDNIAPGYLDTNGSKAGDIVIIRPTTQWADNVHNVLAAGALNDDGTFAKTALDTFYKTSEISPTSFVASGGVIALVSGLAGSFTDIVYYIRGYRYTKTGVANYTFTAVKDTYVDITSAGVLVYTPVANNAASPTLAADSVRLAKVVTNGSAITSVVQTGFDSLGNSFSYKGSVSSVQAPGIWWQEIGRTTLTVAGNAVSVTGLPAMRYLKIIGTVIQSGATAEYIQFNGDGGTSYSWGRAVNGNPATQVGNASNFDFLGDTSQVSLVTGEISNFPNQNKIITAKRNVTEGTVATAPAYVNLTGVWFNSTTSINRIDYKTVTNNFAAGSELVVLGHN